MRAADVAKMQEPYSEEELSLETPDDRVAMRLGVPVPAARAFAAMIYEDLDESTFGVGWWHPQVETKLSIVIGDHLFMAVDALRLCLVEARIHQLELIEGWDQQDGRARRHLRNGGSPLKFPLPLNAMDEMPYFTDKVHLAGVFRAVAHALDCLASVVVAVVDLPLDMKAAAWQRLRRHHDRNPSAFTTAVFAEIDSVGPPCWLDWTIEMRNMLVHRPRVMSFGSFGVIGADLYVPGVAPADRAHITQLLPRTPTGSAVEGLAASGLFGPTMLTEDGSATVERLIFTMQSLVESICSVSAREWERRRAAGDGQINAERQWPVVGTVLHPFEGFAPGSVRPTPDLMMTHGRFEHRARAAALFDDDRQKVW